MMESNNVVDERLTPKPILNDEHLIGRCLDMCSERERIEREQTLDLSKWEIVPGTETFEYPKTDRFLAVKKYRRPAAGNVLHNAEDVRPPHILLKTLEYLVNQILNKVGFDIIKLVDAQKFVRDRTRAIRQDLTIQHATDATTILINESIVRFHIFVDYHLAGITDKADYDPFQNTEQLRKVLLSLHELYNVGSTSVHEGEMRACHLITHLHSTEDLFRINRILKDVPEVRQALQMTVAFYTGNLANYLAVMSQATPLMACLASSHLDALRRKLLESIYKAHSTDVPLTFVSSILGFDSHESTTTYLDKLGIPHDNLVCMKHDVSFPADAVYVRSNIVDQKTVGLGWSKLIFPDIGEAKKIHITQVFNVPPVAESHPLITNITPKINVASLVTEISQGLIDFVSSHQAILIACDTLQRSRQHSIDLLVGRTKRLALSAYSSTEQSFLQELTPVIKQIYWSSLQINRAKELQTTMRRLSMLVYEDILLGVVKNIALFILSDLHRRSKLTHSALSTWMTRTKSSSQLYRPTILTRLFQMCKDKGISNWNLVLLGSWHQVSTLLSKISPSSSMTNASPGSCIFSVSEASGLSITFTWYENATQIIYGSAPPFVVIAFSKSALLSFPLPPSTAVIIVDNDCQDFEEQFMHQLFQNVSNAPVPDKLISLDVVTYFHSKYILPLPLTLLSLGWQFVAEAILNLLQPLNPPWSDYQNSFDPRPFLTIVNNWDLSQIISVEASFDFCEQQSFPLICLDHKLHSIETHLQSRIAVIASQNLIDDDDRHLQNRSRSLLEVRGLEKALQHEQSRSEAFDNLLRTCLDVPFSH